MRAPDPREPKIASLLAESYELLGHLGRGGFATVYRVRNRRLDRIEALKVLFADHEDPDFADRFRQEARVAASLDHPRIVKIFDYGQVSDLCWFTMQLVDGPPLSRELKQNGPWAEIASATLAAAVCDALEYSHNRGIVHRDIKPENILVDAARRPHLMDFGIAKSEASVVHTRAGTIMGSPAYIAPEQLRAGPIDGRADIYSLGATLYRMVSNSFPFQDSDAVRMAMKRFSMPPEPLEPKRPGIDPVFDAIVMRALELEPAARFQTAGEMGKALRAFLAGEPVELPPRQPVRAAGEKEAVGTQTPRVLSLPPPAATEPAISSRTPPPPVPAAGPDPDSLPTFRIASGGQAAAPAPAAASRRKSTRVKVWSAVGILVPLAIGAFILWNRPGAGSLPKAPPEPAATAAPARLEPSPAPTAGSPAASVSPEVLPTAAAPQKRPTRSAPPARSPGETAGSGDPDAPPVRRAVVPAQTESEPVIEIAPAVAREYAGRFVGLRVVIAEDGSVREAHVISPLCPECDRAAVAAVMRYRFKPARDARGKPVESRQAVPVMIPAPEGK
ncbi:MAG TPA: protein kinase [Thermoanaerobaculia bacterium]|nr:protein kinase [Thermoanaerobaculia bacterium]